MNDVVYAAYRGGETAKSGQLHAEKKLKVVLPAGEGKVFTEGGEFPFTKGKAVVIPQGVRHALTFGGAWIMLIDQPMLPLKEVLVCDDVQGNAILRAAESAAYFFSGENHAKNAVLGAIGELVVAYISSLTYGDMRLSPAVKLVRDDIAKNASDPAYSADVYIRKLPLNYDYVRKLFKKQTGVTPYEYLLGLRMARAREILTSGMSNRYSDYTVTQVAEACGFNDPLYFSRTFKKYFGVAPSRYDKTTKDKKL